MTDSATILIADDDETSARFLKRLLTHEGHHVSVVDNAEAALHACATSPPDLVLIDLVEGHGHGFDVCRKLKEHNTTRLIPVVIVTAQSDRQDRLNSINAGADDFVAKPFDATELHARIRSLVRLKRYTDDLESAESVILGLGATIEARDPSTEGHCQRLAAYATTLGQSLGLDENDLAALERGGYLHDIGKIAVPDSVLLKHGKLDNQV
jgi:putative two-component system response regulator